MPATTSARGPQRRRLAALLLALGVFALYRPALDLGFFELDDPLYVEGNPAVLAGLGAASVREAVRTTRGGFWMPLTWLSLAADAALWGPGPRGFHRTNVVLFAAGAALLFLLLLRLTGAFWRSLLAAALFAAHPLRVESVAWIAERKDVLSGLLFLLALHAWARHLERPGAGRHAAALALLLLGLAAKPSLLVFPVLLLVLDLWPLGRLAAGGGPAAGPGPLLREKLPALALCGAFLALTLHLQGGARLGGLALPTRATYAIANAGHYLGETLWPAQLPVEDTFAALARLRPADALLALPLLAAGIALLRLRRRAPWALAGALWFAVALAPVSGIIPTGQSTADRFTFLPHLGLAVAASWALGAAAGRHRARRTAAAVAGTAMLLALAHATDRQLARWSGPGGILGYSERLNGKTAFTQALLGQAAARRGDDATAAERFAELVRLRPGLASAHFNKGQAELRLGRLDAAVADLRAAARLSPADPDVRVSLGMALAAAGRAPEALAELRPVAAGGPADPELLATLGRLLAEAGELEEAELSFRALLRADPGSSAAEEGLERVRMLRARARPAPP